MKCSNCDVVFVPSSSHLDHQQEKTIYDLHQNDPNDHRYRVFLSQIALPLMDRLKPQSSGLDFGCGPGPTLSLILQEQGHRVELYDPFYYPDKEPLSKQYDFITMTEVAEHLSQPRSVFEKIVSMLKSDGKLAVMTQFIPDDLDFSKWGYKNDPTHIVFYSKKTFEWLVSVMSLEIIFMQKNCVIFRRLQ